MGKNVTIIFGSNSHYITFYVSQPQYTVQFLAVASHRSAVYQLIPRYIDLLPGVLTNFLM